MFNPLSAPEVILAVGNTLKQAAGAEQPDDEYARSQLLSAYSVARHLAAEEAARPQLTRWFREALETELGGDQRLTGALAAGREDELGKALCELLAELRSADDPASRSLAAAIRGLLRDLSDREVTALAGAAS